MAKERELLVYSARLAEQAERYEGTYCLFLESNFLIGDLFANSLDRFNELSDYCSFDCSRL